MSQILWLPVAEPVIPDLADDVRATTERLIATARRAVSRGDSFLPLAEVRLQNGRHVSATITARESATAAVAAMNPAAAFLCHDGYVTTFGTDPCPECVGENPKACEECRGTGLIVARPRHSAIVVVSMQPGRRQAETCVYYRHLHGRVLWEQPTPFRGLALSERH